MLNLDHYPQLRMIAWNRLGSNVIAEADALALYEANWRFIELNEMNEHERALLARLVRDFGKGVLCV